MQKNNIFSGFTDEDLTAAGYSAGRAFALLFDGFARGMAEGFAGLEAGGVELVGNGESDTEEKTDIRDCRACWCDVCARLEECQKHREDEEPDGVRPSPCAGCANGMRFKPKERPPCDEYEQAAGNNYG